MNGDRWRLPSGHEGIEVGRTPGRVMISRIVPGHPYPLPSQEYPMALCELMPSRYLRGELPKEKP